MTIDLGLQGPPEPAAAAPEQDDTSRLTFDTRHRVLSPETLVADTEPASLQVCINHNITYGVFRVPAILLACINHTIT